MAGLRAGLQIASDEPELRVALEEEDLRRYYRANSEEFRRPRRVKLREIVGPWQDTMTLDLPLEHIAPYGYWVAAQGVTVKAMSSEKTIAADEPIGIGRI